MNIAILPQDVWNVIFFYSPNYALSTYLHISKEFYSLIKDYTKINNKWPIVLNNIDSVILAGDGYVNVIEWFHSWSKIKLTKWALEHAASKGHVQVLRWTINNGYRIHFKVAQEAAFNGKLEVLEWFKATGYFGLSKTMPGLIQYSILGNQLEIVKWCFSYGDNIEYYDIITCFRINRLDILKWMYDKDIGIDYLEGYRKALDNNHKETTEWFKQTFPYLFNIEIN